VRTLVLTFHQTRDQQNTTQPTELAADPRAGETLNPESRMALAFDIFGEAVKGMTPRQISAAGYCFGGETYSTLPAGRRCYA